MMQNAQKGMAKWTVRILLGLLILSFAMWGINDFVSAPVNPPVAFAGDREIRTNTFMNEARRRIQIVRQQTGQRIDERTAIRQGLYDQTLTALINRNVLLDTADGWNLGVSDDTVAGQIQTDPAFRSPTGNFDRFRFDAVIRNAGFSEGEFIQATREDLINRQIESSIVAGLDRGQETLARAILAFQLETRDIRMIEISNDKLVSDVEISEDDLRSYHADNADAFSTPARRSGRVLFIRPTDVAETIIVDERPIQQAYEGRLEEFSTPETRVVRQAILPDEAAAQAIVDRIGEGVTFDAAVQEATDGPPVNLGAIRPGTLGGTVGDAAFGAEANSIVGPVQSDFGWHVVEIGDVTEEVIRPLEEVRDLIVADLKLESALEEMIDLSNQMEDELAGGATVQDVASAVERSALVLPAIDRGGADATGDMPAADLPPQVLALLFRNAPGDELITEELGDGSLLLVETLSLEEPQLRPFEDVRDDVITAWKQKKQAEVAATRREELQARLKAGTSLEALALEFGLSIISEEGITRQSGAPLLAGTAREAAFSAGEGDVVGGASPRNPSQVLAVVDAIKSAEVEDDDPQVESLTAAFGESFAETVRSEYLQALRDDVGYTVNQVAFRNAIDPNNIYLPELAGQ